ncbi:MAG: beta-eliminating lyase-related protein, partial [Coriobacteriia bacterium]|nr:beta-eliminating lyase-related protein [Coriobacteriia bacterium]
MSGCTNGGRGFGSDNHSGAHPAVLQAVVQASVGHAHPYGDDKWTREATEVLRARLGGDRAVGNGATGGNDGATGGNTPGAECDVAFVFNGTGANCVAYAAVCRGWESVICAESAHVNEDESTAPQHLAGIKLVPVSTSDGKLTPDLVKPHLHSFGFEHHAQPRLISVSNVTELGTVYTPDELIALSRLAHGHSMLLHVDGARIANAAAALSCSLADLSSKAGVDVLSLGGTKNGMVLGEAVVLFGDARVSHLAYVRKRSGQLASKMRFIAAQFSAMYAGDLWLECAQHANRMAALLADHARALGIGFACGPQANEVFALLPAESVPELAERFGFYTWKETPDEAGRILVRWVT